ncbi:MAG: hypothetical protein ACLFNM_00235 [Candidatus Woesearchaeota archaeon]
MKYLLSSKKGQMQSLESIFAVIVILFLIILGIIFFSRAQQEETVTLSRTFADLDDVAQTQIIASLGELSCSEYDVAKTSCFDLYKVRLFNTTIQNIPFAAEYYFNQFGDAKITIKDVYPTSEQGDVTQYVIYENEIGDNQSYSSTMTIIPITLYDSLTDESHFGLLEIQTYRRNVQA